MHYEGKEITPELMLFIEGRLCSPPNIAPPPKNMP